MDRELNLLWGGLPVRMFRSQEEEKVFMANVLNLPLNISDCLDPQNLVGLCGKMCQVSYRQMKEEILMSSSRRLMTQGTVWHGECLTLKALESPRNAVECFLSDILETGVLAQRYYLSPRACQGILRRAKERNKELPQILREALKRQARGV